MLYLPALERDQTVLAASSGAHRRRGVAPPDRMAALLSVRSRSPRAELDEISVRARRNGRSSVLGTGANERGRADHERTRRPAFRWRPRSTRSTRAIMLLSHDLARHVRQRALVAPGAVRRSRSARRSTTLVDLAAGESLVELRATLADGEPRGRALHPAVGARGRRRRGSSTCTVRRVAGRPRARGAWRDATTTACPLHDVARRLAEVVDMAEVLRTLCDIAARQCHGTGAAVLRMHGPARRGGGRGGRRAAGARTLLRARRIDARRGARPERASSRRRTSPIPDAR